MAELALEQTLDLGDYLAAFRRRRGMITLIAASVFLVGLITAFVWPPTYQASATILIEEQEIPTDLVRTTITSYAAQRIQIISQTVMTRANMLEIMDKYGLYEDERKRKTTEQVLADMREDLSINMINAEVMDPRTGRPTAATIAFTVGFKGDDPQLVHKVASELTTLYLNENLRTRTEKTEETYQFLTSEADRLSSDIKRLDTALSDFKEKNINMLPESRDLIAGQLQNTELEIDKINDAVQSAQDKKVYLRGQLATLDPYDTQDEAVMSPATRLQALRSNYISLATRYSPDHPDVISTRREIEALEKEVGYVDTTAEQLAQLDDLKQELATARQTYSDEHPDVKRLNRQIANLEQQLQNPPAASAPEITGSSPSNPAYMTLLSQIEIADIQIRRLRERQERLREIAPEYVNRLMQMPKLEGEYRALVRDYDNATSRYQEIRAKQMTAEVAQSMEKERKGEKFTLIDPANRPEQPISPNRPAIIFLSLVLALGAGAGSAAVAESMASAVRGAKGLVGILNTAPLAVIPYLPSATDTRRQNTRKWLMMVAVIGAIAIVLLLIHFLYSPLDVLWFRGMRKVDNIVGG